MHVTFCKVLYITYMRRRIHHGTSSKDLYITFSNQLYTASSKVLSTVALHRKYSKAVTFQNFCHRRRTVTAHFTALFGGFLGPIFGPGFALLTRVFQGGRKRGHGRDWGEGGFGGEALKRREGIAMRKRVLEEEDGCTTLRCRSVGGEGGRVDVVSLLFELSRLGVRSVMVEGGAQVIKTFLAAGVCNYIVITIAPLFLGGLPALQSKYASGGRHASEEGEGKSSRATSRLVLPPVHEPTFLHVGRDIVLTFTCGLEETRAMRERDGGGGRGAGETVGTPVREREPSSHARKSGGRSAVRTGERERGSEGVRESAVGGQTANSKTTTHEKQEHHKGMAPRDESSEDDGEVMVFGVVCDSLGFGL